MKGRTLLCLIRFESLSYTSLRKQKIILICYKISTFFPGRNTFFEKFLRIILMPHIKASRVTIFYNNFRF